MGLRSRDIFGILCLQQPRQLVNLTFFMGNSNVCSPLGFKKAGVLHFNFVEGEKHYISPFVLFP